MVSRKRFLQHDALVMAVLLGYLCNAYVGFILNHGFQGQVFFVALGLALERAWVEKRKSGPPGCSFFLAEKRMPALI